LSLPKAKVSRAVTKLEQDYGAVLLERTTRGVRLTEVGALLQMRAVKITDEIEAAKAEVSAYGGKPAGTLRIGCASVLGRGLLSPHVAEFLDRYPEILLNLEFGDRLLPRADRYDAVLHAGFLADSSFISRKIVEVASVLVASPAYLASRGTPKVAEDLGDHTVMAATELQPDVGELPVSAGAQVLICGGEEYTVKLDGRLQTNDPFSVVQMARSGKCIAWTASLLVSDELRSGEFEVVLPACEVKEEAAVFALHTYRTAMPPKLRAFLDFVQDLARDAPEPRT
jgi:DNA-binding transcriptional LysR family regulator